MKANAKFYKNHYPEKPTRTTSIWARECYLDYPMQGVSIELSFETERMKLLLSQDEALYLAKQLIDSVHGRLPITPKQSATPALESESVNV